jgi:hypothetical protein
MREGSSSSKTGSGAKRGVLSAQKCTVPYRLLKNRLSDNVGGVKHFSSTREHALKEERHFALVDVLPFPTQARSQSVFRSGTRSDPCISSVC